VLTLPVNVWPDIAFEPPLSSEKRRIAALGNPGASTKVLAVARGVPAGFVAAGWPATLQAVVGDSREMAGGRLVVGFSGVGGIDPPTPLNAAGSGGLSSRGSGSCSASRLRRRWC
jgi:hypothetical protein